MTFSIDNLEGVATTPIRKICSGKTLRITRVNISYASFGEKKMKSAAPFSR